MQIKICNSFHRNVKDCLKKYPLSEQRVFNFIQNECGNKSSIETVGKLCKGYPFPVYKLRLGLEEYNIGKSNGCRLLIAFIESEDFYIVPFFIYKKGLNEEKEIIKRAIRELKSLLEELQSSQ